MHHNSLLFGVFANKIPAVKYIKRINNIKKDPYIYDGKQNTFLCTVLKLKSNYFPRQNKVVKNRILMFAVFECFHLCYMGTGEDLISGKY